MIEFEVLAPSTIWRHLVAWQWRGSEDIIRWSEWRHLCYEDEPTPPAIHEAWSFRFVQLRAVQNGKVLCTSPMFSWDMP